jgi:transcriptional regulator with XRE-family HTH domain
MARTKATRTPADEWVEENPLRLWRKEGKRSLMRTAMYLDVSSLTIQQWENGSAFPKPENMEKLIRTLSQDDLPDKWAAWYATRPRPEGEDAWR